MDFKDLSLREQLDILGLRERSDDEPKTFECCKCEEIVEDDGENSMLHNLCWMCFEDYG